MSNMLRYILILLVCCISSAATASSGSHCNVQEKSLWSCPSKGKVCELCASRDLGKNTGYLQYRAGRVGKIEFAFPKNLQHPRGLFEFHPYARDAGLRFTNGRYEYELFDQLIGGRSEIRISEKSGKFFPSIECDIANESLTDTATFNLFREIGIYD
jgi:hypothetical protein